MTATLIPYTGKTFEAEIFVGPNLSSEGIKRMIQNNVDRAVEQYERVFGDPVTWTSSGDQYYDWVDHKGELAVRLRVREV